MTQYAIKTSIQLPGCNAMYIAKGFGTQGTVKLTDRFPNVRTFKTHKGAERFLSLHGYEIPGGQIVAAPCVAS